MLLALVLLAQTLVGPQYYVLYDYASDSGQMLLVTDNGRYPIDLGSGCDGIQPGNVEWIAGSGGVGAIRTIGTDQLCNVYVEQQVSATACFQTDGVCDVAAESD